MRAYWREIEEIERTLRIFYPHRRVAGVDLAFKARIWGDEAKRYRCPTQYAFLDVPEGK
jgi:hypothetical protein